ncbi:MAG: YfcE family phosphodiesterase [Nitrospirae bacterium]|nr:YfcE family phosphodiesterase [Nitrospirota bacterium]
MKIAVFGDIHGNIDALSAAYQEAAGRKVEAMYHLGDLGGYAPFVNEVVEFLAAHGIEGVQGNYDEAVANNREHCGCKYEDPVQAEMSELSFAWTKGHASQHSREFMQGLPPERTFLAEGKRVTLFHAAPHKNNIYWYEDRPEKFFREMAGKADADILVYGHTHKPYKKELGGKTFVNAGSVGKPKDGDSRACLTVLEITPDTVSVDFIRVPYDVEKTAAAIASSGLPPYFAETLRKGM